MSSKSVYFAQSIGLGQAKRHSPRMRRVTFRSLMLGGMSVALCSVALPAVAANWWSPTPSLSIGSTATINVRNAGAKGDGRHDDTAAFQAAINALPASGGTILVPAGRYMINTLKSINLRSHMRLLMNPLAELVAIPNSSGRYYVIKASRVNNVEINGGSIIGDRIGHIGNTGEWGMGVYILGSAKVFVHNLKISRCWGDGVYVGAYGGFTGKITVVPSSDITLNHVISTGNRRQGLSFGPVQRAYVVNSTFSNTSGTAPQAGIDIEPSTQGIAQNIRIEASKITGNAGNGLELLEHSTGVVITSNTIKGNQGYGVLGVGGANAWITQNLITENRLSGVGMESTTHDVKITSNTVTYNNTSWFLAHHMSIYTLTYSPRDIYIKPTTWNISLANNKLTPSK